jgi:YaiO family outer membrane protein
MRHGICFLLLTACVAQERGSGSIPWQETPFRLEFGGYTGQVNQGLGNWRGAEGQLWIRASKRIVPVLTFDSQTRPTGTQQNLGGMAIINWSPGFYTVQGVSASTVSSGGGPRYFPGQRYDLRGYWKTALDPNFLVSGGYSRVNYGGGIGADMPSLGFLLYKGRLVTEGIAYVVKNNPGSFYSGSATLSSMYGREGKYWIGATVGAGREVHRVVFVNPREVRLNSVSVYAFARKWITRHTGLIVFFDFQNRLDFYQRAGGGVRWFWEF